MTDRKDRSKYYKAEGKGYQIVPEEIFEYPNLEVLSLAENELEVLDERIGSFQQLYSLDLCYNKIQQLPDSFAQLQQLEYLRLNSNQFSTIPAVLFELPKLRYVYLMNNQLTDIPAGIGNWTQLEVLDLWNNQLQALPATMGKLQNLERLNLTFNQFTSFPTALCPLPQLRVLRLKQNQLQELPACIGALKKLQVLDLEFNPLQGLPERLAELSELRELRTTSNQFQTFPEVLLELPQLTDLSALDLEFRLGLSTKKLQTLFSVLKKIDQQKGAKKVLKSAAFALLFDKELSKTEQEALVPLLRIPNKVLQEKLRQKLTEKSLLPTPKSTLFLLGKAAVLTEEVQMGIPWAASAKEASHVVLGQKIKKTTLQQLPSTTVFLSEMQVQRHYQAAPSLEWLRDNYEQIEELLYSQQGTSVLLVLQWLEGSSDISTWATELLLAYILLPHQEKEAIKAIQKTFLLGLPNFDKNHLPHINFKLYTAEKSELEIAKRITQCTAPLVPWKGLKIAHYLFQKYQAGYVYLIRELSIKECSIWLQQFIKGDCLCLTSLKELKKMPPLEGDWLAIRRLDLRGCTFMRAPQPDLLKQMPNLEEIDLRDNPIRHLPRTLLPKLSAYRILISK
ncbi:MAG: leucine-rich repeat domain-containing protein [Aureispira sp.]